MKNYFAIKINSITIWKLIVNSSSVLSFILILFIFSTNSNAQETRTIEVKDILTNKPISYYSLTDGTDWIIGDSSGSAKIPLKLLKKRLNLRCLSYPDTTISFSDSEIKKIVYLKSNNVLNEVVIKPNYTFDQKLKIVKTTLKKLNSMVYTYTSAVYKYPIEYGVIYDFTSIINLKLISFRAYTNYPREKTPAILHIYTFQVGADPVPIEVATLNKIRPVIGNNNFTYDLSNKNIYLNPGKYLISIELIPTNVLGEKISIPLNFTKSTPSKMATAKGPKKWFDTRTGDFTQLITGIEYYTFLKY